MEVTWEWSSSYRTDKYATIDFDGNFFDAKEGIFFSGVTTSHGYQINPTYDML